MDAGAEIAERQEPSGRVEYVPLSGVPDNLRDDEVRIWLRSRVEGRPAAEYLQATARAPTGHNLVAVVTLGLLDSPDTVQLKQVRFENQRLFVHAQVNDFQGRLAANVRRLALVLVDLGDPSSGMYDAVVQIDHAAFTNYGHPETATVERSSSHHAQLEVAPD